MSDSNVPLLRIEAYDMADSGFILDGTQGTPNETQLRAPSALFIPNVGFRKGKKVEKDPKTGKERTIDFNERIRYIRNETEISYQKQEELKIQPNRVASEDKIIIEKGYATIAREGATIGLYDYLKDVFYNASNLDRSPEAAKLFKVIELDKVAEKEVEDEMAYIEAMEIVSTLGRKVNKKDWQFNEEKIDAICNLLAITAHTPMTKLRGIQLFAKSKPALFIQRVTRDQQTAETYIIQSIQLGVIELKNNVAQYLIKSKVIKKFDKDVPDDAKIEALGDYLRTPEGTNDYIELQTELEAAKQKKLT